MSEVFVPPAPLQTAVLFLVFNRPDTTQQVFEAIRRARPPRLYVAADGARASREGEAQRVAQVRQMATEVDWPCVVKTLFRQENLGCKKAVSGGIDWFFENEEQGIILEDDVVPIDGFFQFCAHALEKYKDDERVGMISGTNFFGQNIISNEYFYSYFGSIWGWATWRRAWNKYDINMHNWPSLNTFENIKHRFPSKTAKYFAEIFNTHQQKSIDTWDTQWVFTCVVNSMMSVVPCANLIKNIGIIGTHSSVEMPDHYTDFGCVIGSEFYPIGLVSQNQNYEREMQRVKLTPALRISKFSFWFKKIGMHSAAKFVYEKLKSLHLI